MATTLVIGLGGTGKSTYRKSFIGDALVYDLDAIAAALRLQAPDIPKNERHPDAMRCANELLAWFLDWAPAYVPDIFVIRTAPPPLELERIRPDKLVVCTRQFIDRGYPGEKAEIGRIQQAIHWASENGIPVVYF